MKKFPPKNIEEQKLIEFFNSKEGEKFSQYMDMHKMTPAETAIYYMRRLINIKRGLLGIAREI